MAQQKSQTNALSYCIDLIGGKWKPIILFNISKGINRFNKLFNEIDDINRQMLSKQLKELEKSLKTVVQAMNKWGQKQQEEVKVPKKKVTQQVTLFE